MGGEADDEGDDEGAAAALFARAPAPAPAPPRPSSPAAETETADAKKGCTLASSARARSSPREAWTSSKPETTLPESTHVSSLAAPTSTSTSSTALTTEALASLPGAETTWPAFQAAFSNLPPPHRPVFANYCTVYSP